MPARTYCIDAQGIRGVLHRQSTSKPNLPMLGSTVASRVGLAFDAGDGADVDDVAASFEQMGQCSPAQVARSVQVDRKIVCPVVVGHRLRSAHLVSPGDVDEDV